MINYTTIYVIIKRIEETIERYRKEASELGENNRNSNHLNSKADGLEKSLKIIKNQIFQKKEPLTDEFPRLK
jgi:hypothetical protein